jgi:glycosyltransferase involved in cell wall biosynthesis
LRGYRGLRSGSLRDTALNAWAIWRTIHSRERPDLVHSFGRLAYLAPLFRERLPKIQSYQRHVTPRSVRLGTLLGGPSLSFTACSRFCAEAAAQAGGSWTAIPNGVPLDRYTFRACVPADAPLVFLGRVERIKGAATAIAVARAAGRRLVIAGNHAEAGPEADYFREEIIPNCDGSSIRYVGPVTDEQKNELLGGAAALLFPVAWDEPFGIVMAEALACGTPVLAFPRGAVPEVVSHGLDGFLCDDLDDMVAAVARIGELDRAHCRATCEQRFSDRAVVGQYEALYRQVLSRKT